MKKIVTILIAGFLAATAIQAQARNVKYTLPMNVVLESASANMDPGVKLYFGPQSSPAVLQKFGSAATTNKAGIENRIDIPACQAAFLAALQDLQKNAKAVGANAVVNIESFFKNGAPVNSATEFECHAGSHSAILMLRGDLVKIAD